MLQNNNQNNFSIMKVCIIQGGGMKVCKISGRISKKNCQINLQMFTMFTLSKWETRKARPQYLSNIFQNESLHYLREN